MNHDARADGSDLQNNKRKGCRRKSFATPDDKIDVNHDDDGRKKMHRDMERQRRQEMGGLYASLRSLLPLEYIKGKRSVSDQMNEAVNYINDLQTKIKDMGVKREELKKLSSLSSFDLGDIGSSNKPSLTNVTVSPCWGGGGVEIMINSDFIKRELPLSRVLDFLLDEGVDVVSCISTKVNEGVICRIQSKVGDQKPINLSELQRKLNNMLSSDEFQSENCIFSC